MTVTSTTVGNTPLGEWSSRCGQQESLKGSTQMQSEEWQNGLGSFPGKPFSITIIQAYAPTSNAEEAEAERFWEDLQDLLELTPKKMSFSS